MKSARDKHTYRRRAGRTAAVVLLLFSTVFYYGFVDEDDLLYKVSKGIDLFGSIYKELSFNYVDDLDPEALMEAGIRGMLDALDPYTIYIDEQDKSDVDILTTGQYGGLGITVRRHNNRIIVSNVVEEARSNSSLKIGDEITNVGGTSIAGDPDVDLKVLLRGEPGTNVYLRVRRPGLAKDLAVTMPRRRIVLDNVSFTTVLNDSIGYIRLDRFSRRAGDEVRLAIHDLANETDLKGLILDVRSNPGGLLDAAVDVSEKFLPEGSLIVSTKGRKKRYDKYYYCSEAPILRREPLVILVNGGSASASEILAGAIQDNDRGLIVGTPTFGKGLVQNVIPLSYNSALKITTSKYYTPSGRCIQKIDYAKEDSKHVYTHYSDDTVKTFSTLLLKRGVKEAGGIYPDYVIDPHAGSKLLSHLRKAHVLFNFVTIAVNSGRITSHEVTDATLKAEFNAYLDTIDTEDSFEVRTMYDSLRTLAKEYGYAKSDLKKLDDLRSTFSRQPDISIDRYWHEISDDLRADIALRLGGENASSRFYVHHDPQIDAALRLLSNRDAYLAAFNTGNEN